MTVIDTELHLSFHGRIIDQLGSQTYHSPVASIAELVANAWDADATKVDVRLPANVKEGAEISIQDNGSGLSFRECEEKYLNIGWCKRGKDPVARTKGGRKVLGRKGIGKFAGFGIARIIHVKTTSGDTGEMTSFEMNLDEITSDDYMKEGGVLRARRFGENDSRKKDHGTKITLKNISLERAISKSQLPLSMARRFLLHQIASDFEIGVDGKPIPKTEDLATVEFSFPRDYCDGEIPDGMVRDGDFGVETLSNGRAIKWKMYFYKDTIGDEELQGITVFSNGKLSQSPFFFNLSGGLGGQAGQSYMSGQVIADYVDQLTADAMSAERQRINWDLPETTPLLEWGQKRVKKLLLLWHDRRGRKRREALERRTAGFAYRLEKLGAYEAKTVKKALEKLGGIPTLSEKQFEDTGNAMLTAWEGGRLHALMADMAEASKLSPDKLLELLTEAKVVSALNVAEVIKTRLLAISQLEKMVDKAELESKVRDHLADNPWIISPKWETFKVETSVNNIIKESAGSVGFLDKKYKGRVDLVLGSGDSLIVLEFMRPGLKLDWEHTNRFRTYVRKITAAIKAGTGGQYRRVTGQLVASQIDSDPGLADEIESMERDSMWALDWGTLLCKARSEYSEYMDIIFERGEDDERVKALSEGFTQTTQ